MPVKKRPVSPRQKMINLMYVVLMAMLALNVSSDVLNGFSIVENSIRTTTSNATEVNRGIYADLEEQMQANPVKVRAAYEKAQTVRAMSDSLYNFAESLKQLIVQESDGRDGDVNNIRNREDLEAASSVMLAPGTGRGRHLFEAINSYRERVITMVEDSAQRRIIASNLSTELPASVRTLGKNWQEYMFESMPTAAAVTLLTKLQSDVRYAEGEVLHDLSANIGVKDIRVNELNAYVIPSAQTVVQGGKFSAQILMAAIDTTNRPTIYIGGQKVQSDQGIYETVCTRTGDFTLVGYIEMMNAQGDLVRRDFQQKYTVVEPSATVSADLMNVLYAGYDNPMSVSVPGVSSSQLQVTMSGGTLTARGDGRYVARPTAVGTDAVINVAARTEGRVQEMGRFTFRVRKLPDPAAFIAYDDGQGGENRFRGGKIAKKVLLDAPSLGAAVDDGLLNIPFRVQGFETVFYDNMGNAIPEVANSADFTARQKKQIRDLSRGKRFFITRIRAIGPDGVERTLDGAMDVTIN